MVSVEALARSTWHELFLVGNNDVHSAWPTRQSGARPRSRIFRGLILHGFTGAKASSGKGVLLFAPVCGWCHGVRRKVGGTKGANGGSQLSDRVVG
jgi:mono/diheme cytochrome c family protein